MCAPRGGSESLQPSESPRLAHNARARGWRPPPSAARGHTRQRCWMRGRGVARFLEADGRCSGRGTRRIRRGAPGESRSAGEPRGPGAQVAGLHASRLDGVFRLPGDLEALAAEVADEPIRRAPGRAQIGELRLPLAGGDLDLDPPSPARREPTAPALRASRSARVPTASTSDAPSARPRAASVSRESRISANHRFRDEARGYPPGVRRGPSAPCREAGRPLRRPQSDPRPP